MFQGGYELGNMLPVQAVVDFALFFLYSNETGAEQHVHMMGHGGRRKSEVFRQLQVIHVIVFQGAEDIQLAFIPEGLELPEHSIF